MSEELIKYDCRNCGHWVVTKLRVEGEAKCKECGSVPMDQRPTSNGIQEEKVELKDTIELLSKFSTKELIEALEVREDVQVVDTDEDVYKVSMDLFKVKKHVLLINNCNAELVERQRELFKREYLGTWVK
ncbi:hypothetical protein [Bacillus thuringiensis]|uniref:hypothetical protein n=1 Tax=Bacillus thuringiensis TaxID=1428 RepID=UPI00211D98AD|nr:hypothetical protein [Bacillus thuringiensis]